MFDRCVALPQQTLQVNRRLTKCRRYSIVFPDRRMLTSMNMRITYDNFAFFFFFFWRLSHMTEKRGFWLRRRVNFKMQCRVYRRNWVSMSAVGEVHLPTCTPLFWKNFKSHSPTVRPLTNTSKNLLRSQFSFKLTFMRSLFLLYAADLRDKEASQQVESTQLAAAEIERLAEDKQRLAEHLQQEVHALPHFFNPVFFFFFAP